MGMLANLYVKLGLKADKFQSELDKSKKKASGFGKAMKQVGGMVAGAFAFGAVIKGIKTFIKTNVDFEQSIANLASITGATGDDLKYFEEQAINLGATTTQSAAQVAKAFELVGSAKPDLLQSKEALAAVTKEAITLAEAATMSMPDAAAALTGAMNQFGLPAEEASRVINVLAAGSKAGASDINSLNESMKNVGAVASGAGMSLEQTVGALETLGLKQIKGAEAGTALRGVIMKLQKAGMGYSSGSFVLADALEEANGKINSQTTALEKDAATQKIFGALNITAGKIMLQNADKYGTFTDAVTGTQTAYEQQATNTATLEASFKSFGSAIEGVILSFRESTGVIKSVVDHVTVLINKIRENSESIKAWAKYLSVAAASFGVIKLAIFAYKKAVIGAKLATDFFKKGVKGLNAAMKANVIMLIVSALIALGLYFVDLYKTSDVFRAKFKYATAKTLEFFQNMWIGIKEGAEMMWLGIKTYFTAIPKAAKAMWNIVKRAIKGENIGDAIKDEFGKIVTSTTDAAKKIKDKYSDEFAKIKSPSYEDILSAEKGATAGEKAGKEVADGVNKGVEENIKPVKVPIAPRMEKMDTMESKDVDGVTAMEPDTSMVDGLADMNSALEAVNARTSSLLSEQAKEWNDFKNSMANTAESFVEGVVTDLAAGFGEMIAAGDIDAASFGQSALEAIGGFMTTIGGMMISMGIASEWFQSLLASSFLNPAAGPGLIIAGAALVAIGSAISATAKNMSSSGGSSSSSGGVSTSTGSYATAAPVTSSSTDSNVNVTVRGEISGDNLSLSNSRNAYKNNVIG